MEQMERLGRATVFFGEDWLKAGVMRDPAAMGRMIARLKDFYKEERKVDRDAIRENAEQEAKELEAKRKATMGDPEDFKRMMEEQTEIQNAVAKETVKREELMRQIRGITDEEHKLQLLRNQLAIAEEKSQERKAEELRKSIEFQKQLIEEQEKLEQRKKDIQVAKDYIDEIYNHEEKRIADTLKAKTDVANKDFKRQQELADAARAAGGPSGDFTAGGADYRFVQQRIAESEARRISDRANNKRESQLQELIDIAEDERIANREWRDRELNQPQFVKVP
jgi:hypothetical protein